MKVEDECNGVPPKGYGRNIRRPIISCRASASHIYNIYFGRKTYVLVHDQANGRILSTSAERSVDS